MQTKSIMLIATLVILGISLVKPIYPNEQYLQHAPTAFIILGLAMDCRKQWLTLPTFICTVFFLWLHILGARYIYSYVPYDNWLTATIGQSSEEMFGFSRNHYDRLVHFSFGGLCMIAGASSLARYLRCSIALNLIFSFCMMSTLSGIYEVFEWMLTVVMAPGDADAYNGQQGDNWDAQKDIALAMLGSLIVIPIAAREADRSTRKDRPESC